MLQAKHINRQIKRPIPKVDDEPPARKFLAFTLSLEEFCIDLSLVQDILDFEVLDAIPKSMPDFVSGQLSFRGEMIPAIDMRTLFNIGSTTVDAYTPIIVVLVKDHYVGLIVDCIIDEIQISSSQIKSIFTSLGSDFDFMIASSVVENRKIVIIDVEKLILTQEIISQKETIACH